jgi:hypothetical protein
MVIVPSWLDFVNAKNSDVEPVVTLKFAEVSPAVLLTGFSVVEREEIINELVAETMMFVPASTPVREKRTASDPSTKLSDGTVTLAGVVDTAAVVMTTPFILNVIVGAALAGVAPISDTRSPPASNVEINDFLETDMPYSIQKLNLGYSQTF